MVRDDTLIMTSELVTNAVRYGSGLITVAAETDGRAVCVSVTDGSDEQPRLRPHGVAGEGGRGLTLVAALATTWGVRPLADGEGKAVWFRVG